MPNVVASHTQPVDKTKPHLTVRTLLLSSVASRDPKIAEFAATVRAVDPSMNDADLTAVRDRPTIWQGLVAHSIHTSGCDRSMVRV